MTIIFAFRKLALNTIYNTYMNQSPFKNDISIFGGGGMVPCLFCLHRAGGGPEF